MSKYILALDQGTTSSRAILFSPYGDLASSASYEFEQIFPKSGWVEHNPQEIFGSQLRAMRKALEKVGATADDILTVGITNQRETTIVWERDTGNPIYNAIVWQCRRTAAFCDELVENGYTEVIREKTGLLIDAYFSASKLKWILDHVSGARERAVRGELCFGTVDTWLLYNLTGGKVHATDYSNASRTMLFNIHTLTWDEELLKLFDIPLAVMPTVLPSAHRFGFTDKKLLGKEIPISGIAGDQQAALFGQNCQKPGDVKNTYGTGGFLLMNTGNTPVTSQNGLLTSIAWGIGKEVTYALEGSVFICGAAIQWLRDSMGLLASSAESEEIAMRVKDTEGVCFVPAFVGLGTPYWDPYARGAIFGITRGTTKAHIVRAVLEAMCFQTADVVRVMQKDAGQTPLALRVDGGASANDLLLQMQADLLNLPIRRPACIETTAFGAASLAGLCEGCIELPLQRASVTEFLPQISEEEREAKLALWHKAAERTLGWAKENE
ncbi:MAG: glycerol kinase GlpK [Ruminococcaceae bacterium]|nr:glycerol kinase GlpK [Oscillospiraceae bacterium]